MVRSWYIQSQEVRGFGRVRRMDTRGVKYLLLVIVVNEAHSILYLFIKIKLKLLRVGDEIVWLCCYWSREGYIVAGS